MRANYHTHTRWCKHGEGEIEDYIEEAIRCGLEVIAITEHVPHRDNLDPRRIQWEEFLDYDACLNRAIRQYSGKIKMIKGFECEYYPEEMADYRMFQRVYGYELFFLGQHRSGEEREIDNFAPKGKREMQIYADEVCRGIATGFFTFLAHPDLALQGYGQWDESCEAVMRQIFAACEKHGVPVEININGLRDKRSYPNEQAFTISKEYGLRYLINSDAHRPCDLCDGMAREAERFAARLGLPVIERLEFGRQSAGTG